MKRTLPLWLLMALPIYSLEIRTSELPWAVVNTVYHSAIETGVNGHCEDGDAVLSVSQGMLPPGIEIKGMYLLGTPKETGTFHFSLRAANNCTAAVKDLELVVTGKPILRVFPESYSVESVAGKPPAPQAVQVFATWPDLPYTIHVDVPWVTARVRSGVTPEAGSSLASDVVTLEIDPKGLPPGRYRTAVRFSTWLGANAPVVYVSLRVVAAQPDGSEGPQ
jgi:hypothetical protein